MQFVRSWYNYAEQGDRVCDWGSTQMASVSGDPKFIHVQHRPALPGTCKKPAVEMME